MNPFTGEANKALVGAAVAFLGPLLVLLQAEVDLSLRSVLASVVSGLVAGLSVYATRNAHPRVDDEPGRHAVDRRT